MFDEVNMNHVVRIKERGSLATRLHTTQIQTNV